jgi:prefoldin subunit 5
MNPTPMFSEERELDEVLAKQQALEQRIREFERSRREIERKLAENERTIPPLADLTERERLHQFEQIVSRGVAVNIRRDQNHALLMLCLLVSATLALVCWGLRLMQGA